MTGGLAILFGFYTGARLSDIANMTWDFVDFEKGIICFVAGKTKKQTTIPLHTHSLRKHFLILQDRTTRMRPLCQL